MLWTDYLEEGGDNGKRFFDDWRLSKASRVIQQIAYGNSLFAEVFLRESYDRYMGLDELMADLTGEYGPMTWPVLDESQALVVREGPE